ncbi:LysE family translocator [Nocardiopsis chromatogenes]|uniref:LysE family translocator n=1 Tax=Nocardiopsis chromatogenes TaxID=280239 RepID=UPI001360B39B|nr:LysE family translocator [Nocardiopsis chromatogenes]
MSRRFGNMFGGASPSLEGAADHGRARMNPTSLLAFWVVILALIAIPGPDWAFIIAVGSRNGKVVAGAGGLMIGYSVVGGLVAVGVGAVVAQSESLLAVLTAAGAVFLVYIGITVLRSTSPMRGVERPEEPRHPASRYGELVSGIAVSMLNPKGLLIMIAPLPQFADTAAGWAFPVQLAVLGLIFAATCGVFYTVLGVGTRAALQRWRSASTWTSRISGAALIVLGLVLLIEQALHRL